MEGIVREIRAEDPGIGAYKLFLILKDIYGKRMFGRDRFYKFLHQKHLMLPAQNAATRPIQITIIASTKIR